MKSYYLADSPQPAEAAAGALDALLPGQQDPWILLSSSGDAIAYFYLPRGRNEEGELVLIQADVSGRHYDEDDKVIAVFKQLQATLGGTVKDDGWNEG